MTPLPSTIISSIFLAIGAFVVFSMVAIQGRTLEKREWLRKTHKVMGYVFVGLYLLMFVTMIVRVEEYWEPSSPRANMHVTLSVLVFVLLALKVTIPRFFRKLYTHLFLLGVAVYAFSFTLVGLSAGYYIVWRARDLPYISHAKLNPKMMDLELGKQLFILRCSTCHELNSIMRPRTPDSWDKVLNQMVEIARPRIKPDEAGQILHYLIITQSPQPKPLSKSEDIIERSCMPCHKPTDIFSVHRSYQEWKLILKQMHDLAPEHVPADRIDDLLKELSRLEKSHVPGQTQTQPQGRPANGPPANGPPANGPSKP